MTTNESMLPVDFAGSISASDFSRVQSLLLPVWARWYFFVPCVLYINFVMGQSWSGVIYNTASLIANSAISFFILGVCWAITWYGRRRNWRNLMSLAGQIHGRATIDGIEWNTENTSAKYEWKKIIRVRRVPHLTLAFYTPRCAFYFPRSFFQSEEAWNSFNQALASYATNALRRPA